MSNSRVESHSRAELRNKIISAATLLEILLSGLVLIGLLLSMVPLLKWMPGLLFDGNDVEVSIFLQRALDIVIGIEFIKMLAKHSPGSSLEVLLYAIARHMVVGHESAMENLLSVSAIALIFIVRRFFFVPAFGAHLPDGLCGCATSRRDFPITKFFSCRINGKDFKRRTVHPEPDIASGKGKSVNPFGIILIGRARIKGQNLTQRLPFACGKSLQDFPSGTHLKPGFRLRSRKTACRLRDTVGVGEVGFYIQNRRSVKQIGPRNP